LIEHAITTKTGGAAEVPPLCPRSMLLEIITRREVSFTHRNLFDCAKGRPFSKSIAQDPSMFEAITAFLLLLSVGILIAHALDAFRLWT
jgi:hypothetical protein